MNFREWPLVFFTLLAQTAAGAAAAFFLVPVLTGVDTAGPAGHGYRLGAAIVVLILVSFSAALSLFHLGRPDRSPRAILNITRSWLSREISLLLLFLASAAAMFLLEAIGIEAGGILGPLTAVAGFVCVISMARIYMLPAVPEWNTWRTPAAFLSSAFVLGGLTAAVYIGNRLTIMNQGGGIEAAGRFRIAVLIVLAAAFVLNILFLRRSGLGLRRKTQPGIRLHPARPGIFLVRLILSAASVLFLIMAITHAGSAGVMCPAALAAAAISEIIGRLQSYDLRRGL